MHMEANNKFNNCMCRIVHTVNSVHQVINCITTAWGYCILGNGFILTSIKRLTIIDCFLSKGIQDWLTPYCVFIWRTTEVGSWLLYDITVSWYSDAAIYVQPTHDNRLLFQFDFTLNVSLMFYKTIFKVLDHYFSNRLACECGRFRPSLSSGPVLRHVNWKFYNYYRDKFIILYYFPKAQNIGK